MPSTNPLIPDLAGRYMTVDVALNSPTFIRDAIAELATEQTLLDKFFSNLGAPVQGGAMLYTVTDFGDLFTSDVEARAPLAEYKVVEGVDPDPHRALVTDYGGKFQVSFEQRNRNAIDYLTQQTRQLANRIALKLDSLALTTVNAAAIEDILIDGDWSDLVFEGPLDQITPSADRPSAHLSAAQLEFDLDRMGVRPDLIVCNPTQAHQLRTAYGDALGRMLESAGVSMFSHVGITENEVFVLQRGRPGILGLEVPLTVDVWEDRATRSWWVQAYVVPAFAINRPYAAKKLVLNGVSS